MPEGDALLVIVTPLAGVWIEIREALRSPGQLCVTPLAGVWIEILLAWRLPVVRYGHSPCGSVD